MQTVSSNFNTLASGHVRPLSWAFRMSFDKVYNDDTEFFILDTSTLDGVDLLAPDNNDPIQSWDHYTYADYTDRVQSMEWTREIEFPYSVSSSISDVVLENTDGYFTPQSTSPITDYILPKRPMRILSGFNNENIPQFVGITEKMPTVDDESKTASFHSLDFLSEMYNMSTTEILSMQDARTDEVLAAIFAQYGLNSASYSLDAGQNIIPFLFYDKDTSMSKIFRDLMQAEMGNLWIDEAGIIRFNNRYTSTATPIYTFDDTNTVSVKTISDDNIINIVKITANIRDLQSSQSIYSMSGNTTAIPASGTGVVSISLTDPCSVIIEPTLGVSSTTSWFTAIKTSDSTSVSTNVTVTGHSLKANSLSIFFSNTNAFGITIDAMEIWGTPAKIIDTIDYKELNQNSIDKYGEKVLEINNDFIQSIDQCDSLALPILQSYSEYANQLELEVKGNPALQLSDIVVINSNGYSGTYRIAKTVNKLRESKYTQILTCMSTDVFSWFTLDSSILDGTDVLTI